jgi:hypothetical protein
MQVEVFSMGIDARKEELYTLQGIRQFLPRTNRTGNPVHPSVVFRWIKRGIKAGDGTIVRLKAIKAGSRLCTTREAVDRFFDDLTARAAGVAPLESRAKPGRHERTSRKLVSAGLK